MYQGSYDFDPTLPHDTTIDHIQSIENSVKWQTSFVINMLTQSTAFWISVPVTWFMLSE